MKAFLIDATTQTITPVMLTDGLFDIGALIGFDSVDSDEIDASGDRLFFDERCFLREQTGKARFKNRQPRTRRQQSARCGVQR